MSRPNARNWMLAHCKYSEAAGHILNIYNSTVKKTERWKGRNPGEDPESNIAEPVWSKEKRCTWLMHILNEVVDPGPAMTGATRDEQMNPQNWILSSTEEWKVLDIIGSISFRCLISDLEKELRLNHDQLDHLRSFSQQILLAASQKFGKANYPRICKVFYKANWALMSFLRDQYSESEYRGSLDLAFERAVVLSGSATYGQATTCSEYMKQNWPLHADVVIGLVKSAIQKAEKGCATTISGIEGMFFLCNITQSTEN
jgi:hypothetical protein